MGCVIFRLNTNISLADINVKRTNIYKVVLVNTLLSYSLKTLSRDTKFKKAFSKNMIRNRVS